MPNLDAVEAFSESVRQGSIEVKSKLDNLISNFYSLNKEQKISRTSELQKSCNDLRHILTREYCPQWISQIHNACTKFIKNSEQHGNNLLLCIVQVYPQVKPIILNSEGAQHYDLDSMYETACNENKIPEFFDKLITLIKDIIDSGGIESISILKSLSQLLDMLKINRSGSCGSMFKSFTFVKLFSKNFLLNLLKRIPGIQETVGAYESAIAETEKAFQKTDEDMEQLMRAEIIRRLPNLKLPAEALVPESYIDAQPRTQLLEKPEKSTQ